MTKAPLTPLETRTATLLTIIGVLGSSVGVFAIAPFYYLFLSSPLLMCDSCTHLDIDAVILRSRIQTLGIMVLSIVLSFLPRIIYGFRLRQARKQRELSGK